VNSILEKGSPAGVIARYTDRNPVDLIMMPTHGCGTFRAALLGSVTEKVIHDTQCPVWTSVHTEKINNPVYPYRLIVCAIDDLESSIPVVRKAGEVASAFESSLLLVHAAGSSEKRTESELRSRLEQLGWSGEVSVPICIEAGAIADVITRTAVRYGADLVIIGRGRSTKALASIRSHVFGIIRESPCPVLTA
jgi:nucleotide-binding universal stress UspA family protein